VNGRKQDCAATTFSRRSAGDNRPQIAWRRLTSLGSGVTAAGSSGSGGSSEKAVMVFPLALTSGHDAAGLLMIIEEERIRRDILPV
jgi:hypothetical protein